MAPSFRPRDLPARLRLFRRRTWAIVALCLALRIGAGALDARAHESQALPAGPATAPGASSHTLDPETLR